MRIVFIPFFILFFIGCSQNSFEPEKIDKKRYITTLNSSSIKFFTKRVATLKNGIVLDKDGNSFSIPTDFVAIDKHLAKKGSILKVDNREIEFNNLIVTASKNGELVAILFSDNHFELYNLESEKTISKLNFGSFIGARKFIAQPYFYKNLLLIPTLNGKIVIFDLLNYKVIKSMVVSQKDYFNNIIYLNVKNDNLIIASRDNLIIIAPNLVLNKTYNIKHLLVTDNFIYLFTIEGEVIKLNFSLKELKRRVFKYAKILSPVFYNNKIYFLVASEKSFLISLDENLDNEKIVELKYHDKQLNKNNDYYDLFYLDKPIFFSNGRYYIGEFILDLE